jgi:catechol 2,3-dioxygenase-like lactoylglutathione lyase family enzyme
MVSTVHHVSFLVRDLERSRRFYEGVMELETIPRPDLGLPGVWYRAGASEVHLIAAPAGVEVPEASLGLSPLANHSAFAIEDYEKTLAELKRKGVEVFETSAASGQLWIRDPDGNVIEFIVARS